MRNKYIMVCFGVALLPILFSCSSNSDRYKFDGTDLPGYSDNEFYGTLEFIRYDGLMHKSSDVTSFYYHNPGSYTTIKAEGIDINYAYLTLFPFLLKPSVQTFQEIDTAVHVKGSRGKNSLTYKVRKYKRDRPLRKIDLRLEAGYYHEEEKLWAAPVYPVLEWFDCGKKHRNETHTIKPVAVNIEYWYDPDTKTLEKVKQDAIRNSNLTIRLIDFEGCFKVINSGGRDTVDAIKELPYVI